MSLRSMVLNRPLRARSSLTSWATSNDAAASSADAKGTMAMGMASVWPFVTSTTNSPWARQEITKLTARRARHARGLFIWSTLFFGMKVDHKISFKQSRVRRRRQWRCTIHRILDRLARGCIAVALAHMRAGHLPAWNLCNVYNAIEPGTRRRRLDPRILNSARQSCNVLRARRACLHGADMFLLGELPV